jgi:hyperosmotically inducible periplasmic protein
MPSKAQIGEKMKSATIVKVLTTKLVLVSCLGLAWAQQEPSSAPASVAPDNTKVNQQDRNEQRVTADQQKENGSDRQMTQQIRKALVKDKSLSTYAHNVKVIAQGGTVTLKGPVRSEQEKQAVEAKAAEIAGPDKVKSEISVAPDKKHASDNQPQQ